MYSFFIWYFSGAWLVVGVGLFLSDNALTANCEINLFNIESPSDWVLVCSRCFSQVLTVFSQRSWCRAHSRARMDGNLQHASWPAQCAQEGHAPISRQFLWLHHESSSPAGQKRQSQVCSTVAVAIIAETRGPSHVSPSTSTSALLQIWTYALSLSSGYPIPTQILAFWRTP